MTSTKLSARLAAVGAASAVAVFAGCGEDGEIDTPDDVQQQIDDVQQDAEDRIDDAQDAIDDPVGEGAEEAQKQLDQELQGEGAGEGK